ncbi:putative zinc finger transcriptional activator of the zn2cys6 [Erysiphe neolycopersici]|uniref:Putative zinc finger transcriptional activator of the zn2cys6 n=1 Tax=Erysiphe neolycopersici TaxID=212602 RepID=A0A420HEG5_9PEZI|nr:putative zinc finger transcriptional activator of the zn2cys6 [Erysiphe neolycopersici]
MMTMSAAILSLPLSDKSDETINNSHSPIAQELNFPKHKRVYQACIPCRRRKVKCDLGSVDNPDSPPCVRCRRESKECFFSATRRKRKHMNDKGAINKQYEYHDYALRNGRKMVTGPGSSPVQNRQSSIGSSQSITISNSMIDVSTGQSVEPPLTPGGSIGCLRPLRRPIHDNRASPNVERDRELCTQLENLEAQDVMRQQVYGPYDALDLLYKAATDSDNKHNVEVENQLPFKFRKSSFSSHHQSPTEWGSEYPARKNFSRPSDSRQEKIIDPLLSSNEPIDERKQRKTTKSPGYYDALKAWARFRFVRAGLFTAAEAITYIDYYYEYLSPLTPISPPTFRDPATHLTLLTEEPFLAVTLLSIASRYYQIPDPGGHCRSYAIHEQLWTYLRGMIERCLWGQEAFGGSYYGSTLKSNSFSSISTSGRGLRKGNLRALGTIESLMILTEWHPRALHFPPVDITDELMIPSYNDPEDCSSEKEENSCVHRSKHGIGGKRIKSWLEPAWRSDRMCWMLLSTAMGLSYELGVFDNVETILAASGEISRPEYREEAYRLRSTRIKRLLLIYATQLAGRLGWTSMVPENLRSADPSFDPRNSGNFTDAKNSAIQTNLSDIFNYIPDLELDDQVIHCWAGITNVMRVSNESLFNSRQHTTKIIQDGRYVDLLQIFQPMLRKWKREFELFRLPLYIRHILTIEYEYTRIYIYSLSLQAVVERCTNHGGLHSSASTNGNSTARATISPAIRDYYCKLPLARLGGIRAADQNYIREVVDGSRNLLRTVVEGLLPNNYLKHAPVRTYFRIISGAMFLLKTFALGASKSDVEISIELMHRAVDALRNCIVDDAHLGNQFADLLETLTSRLRGRFVSVLAGPTNNDVQDWQFTSVEQEINDRRGGSHTPFFYDWNTETTDSSPNNPNNDNDNVKNSNDCSVSATPFDLQPLGSYFLTSDSRPLNSTGDYNLTNASEKVQDFSTDSNLTNDWEGQKNEVWYLPPGMAFFENINDQTVAQTSEGVNVGGMDLLDFMALDPPEAFQDNSIF